MKIFCDVHQQLDTGDLVECHHLRDEGHQMLIEYEKKYCNHLGVRIVHLSGEIRIAIIGLSGSKRNKAECHFVEGDELYLVTDEGECGGGRYLIDEVITSLKRLVVHIFPVVAGWLRVEHSNKNIYLDVEMKTEFSEKSRF